MDTDFTVGYFAVGELEVRHRGYLELKRLVDAWNFPGLLSEMLVAQPPLHGGTLAEFYIFLYKSFPVHLAVRSDDV